MRLLPSLTGPGADEPGTVRIDGRTLSRAELFESAAAVAARVAGARAVAVRADVSPEAIAAVLGGLLAGVPVVPVPPDSGPVERAHILRDSGAALLLSSDPLIWPDCPIPVVPVNLGARAGGTLAEPPLDTTALILYTSGTTGLPKGVPVTARAIGENIDALTRAWDWSPDDTLAHGLPLFHVHGLVLGVLGALRVGSKLVHTGRPTPEAYAGAGGSLYFGVPTVWSRIGAEPAAAKQLGDARLLVSGSAALPTPVFERIEALTGHRLVERYGMTETLITLSATAADQARRAGTVGFPLDGVSTRVVGEDGLAVSPDGSSIGELHIQSATVFAGYVGQAEANATCFTEDGWFRTGDLAVIEPDGAHRIVGRASTELIKSGGYRIGAGEVENALMAHPGVREAAVIGLPDEDLGQRVAAFVVAEGVTGAELSAFVSRSLSAHKRPRVISFVDALPRNAMGKVRKDQLG